MVHAYIIEESERKLISLFEKANYAFPSAKGSEIEVTARTQVVIFGMVRYCRRPGTGSMPAF